MNMLSFRKAFFDSLADGIIGRKTLYNYIDNETLISISFEYVKKDNIYKFNNITWIEEGPTYMFVCNSEDDYVIFDPYNNTIIKDCKLYDKYDDGSEGSFYSKIII